jgi:hypothetical protein
MTRLGVGPQVVHCDQSLDFRCACLFFRAGAAGRFRGELSVLGGLGQDPFLTVHMKDQLARRAHVWLWAKIKLLVCKGVNRSHSDPVHHVEVFTKHRK